MNLRLRKIRRSRQELAQTMVEFALVFPIILLITYGIMEFGRMIFIYAAVTGAAREGARYGAATGYVSGHTRYYMDCSGITTAAQRGALLNPIHSSDISIWYDRGPGTSVVSAACPPIDGFGIDKIKLGDRVVVDVISHYSPIIPFLNFSGFDIHSRNARTIVLNVSFGK